jgi:type I restriction enzyme S subunit
MSNFPFATFDSAPFEIIDGDRGKNYPNQNEFSDTGYCLFLNASNITRRGFDFSHCQFITEQRDNALRKGKLKRDDVVLTTRGTIGNAAFFNEFVHYDYIRINSGMVILRCNKEGILPAYLYHFLRSPHFHGQVNSLRSGVAQPQLPIRDMRRIKLTLPKVPMQQSIVSILSAYDDLIENNRRRIQLLEQGARLLYKEWFVHLRFPGHEHVTFTDGVPEGWEKKSLADLADSVSYGLTASSTQEEVGPKFLRITDIVPAILNWDEVPFCEATEKEIDRNRLEVGDVVVARTGATVGYAKLISYIASEAVYASYLVRFRFRNPTIRLISGIFMESDTYKEHVRNHAGGAAQPNANAKVLGLAILLIPPQVLQEQFSASMTPIFNQRDTLISQNDRLAKARDLLLPRLMSGEVLV